MKLLDALHFNYVVVLLVALTSLHSSIAPDSDRASSSAQTPPAYYGRPRRYRAGSRPVSQPSSQPGSPLQPPRDLLPAPQRPLHESVRSYINSIDVNRIERMPFTPKNRRYADGQPYATVPFFKQRPVFSTDESLWKVEKALLDYRSAYVVTPSQASPDARVLSYDPIHKSLSHRLVFEDPSATRHEHLDLSRLVHAPAEVHVIRKGVQGRPVTGSVEADRVPAHEVHEILHVGGAPVLEPSPQVTRAHMIRAARMSSHGFWYKGDNTLLVDPGMEAYVRDVSPNQLQALEAKVGEYQQFKADYGDSLASLVHGAPIHVDGTFEDLRRRPITLEEYPRYSSNANRLAMVNTLQQRGRFRYFDTRPGRSGAYRVRLENPDAAHYTEALISVKPLSWLKLREEDLLRLRGKFHLLA